MITPFSHGRLRTWCTTNFSELPCLVIAQWQQGLHVCPQLRWTILKPFCRVYLIMSLILGYRNNMSYVHSIPICHSQDSPKAEGQSWWKLAFFPSGGEVWKSDLFVTNWEEISKVAHFLDLVVKKGMVPGPTGYGPVFDVMSWEQWTLSSSHLHIFSCQTFT